MTTDVLHGALVMSTIARGEVVEIDTGEARPHPGVVAVYTHADMPRLTVPDFPHNRPYIPMRDTLVRHAGQPVAHVVAETLEQAQEAAALVRVRYRAQDTVTRVADALGQAFLPRPFRDRPNELRRPVCADTPSVEALFVDRPDGHGGALGARGFGETPGTGVPAAIGNAIYRAIGRRLRDVPFTLDKPL